jgi:hypothetical protein
LKHSACKAFAVDRIEHLAIACVVDVPGSGVSP